MMIKSKTRKKMRVLKIIFAASLMLFAQLAVASNYSSSGSYVLYVEPDAGVKPILQAIGEAKQEVDVVMYLFSYRPISKALAEAAHRGVKVKVLLDKAPYKSTYDISELRQYFEHNHVDYRLVPTNRSALNFYHEKMLLIDHKQTWIMTSNFTYSSFSQNSVERNFVLQDQNAKDTKEVQQLFDADWADQKFSVVADTNLVISPINSRERLTKMVLAARSDIKIYAEQISDYDFMGALAKASSHGVKTMLIIDTKLKPKAEKYFRQHNIQFRYTNNNFKNHAKAIIVDGNAFYLGSINFTQNSFEANRELGITLENTSLAKALLAQFQTDWAKLN
jgi:phosphatidylserine/phosphatidylglycerophosphate/cardiolipin synthase-like enzyme